MSGLNNSPRVSILGLELPLAHELAAVLKANQCHVELSSPARSTNADIVFCSSERNVYQKVLRMNPARPIVVVSRIPKVSDWLDALEAGAADYCAAPFESTQIRWLIDTHLRVSRGSMAAA